MAQNTYTEIYEMSTIWVYLYVNHLKYAGFQFNYSLHQALLNFVFSGEVRNNILLLSLKSWWFFCLW